MEKHFSFSSLSESAALTRFIDELPEQYRFRKEEVASVQIILDEVLNNIFTYNPLSRIVVAVRLQYDRSGEIVVCVEDNGIPFNPLAQELPDLTLPADERRPGGLGIYLLRSLADGVTYSFIDRKNVLTIKKMLKL